MTPPDRGPGWGRLALSVLFVLPREERRLWARLMRPLLLAEPVLLLRPTDPVVPATEGNGPIMLKPYVFETVKQKKWYGNKLFLEYRWPQMPAVIFAGRAG